MLSAITPPENNLFSALQQRNTSVKSIVSEWFEDFDNDPISARLQLLRLIFAAAGSYSSFDEAALEDPDGIADVLENLQDAHSHELLSCYPLAYKTKTKSLHRTPFQRSFADFWNNLISQIGQQLADEASSNCLEIIQTWVTVISSSSVRQFRHVATFVALQIISTLCSMCHISKKSTNSSRRQSFKRQGSMTEEDRNEYLKTVLTGLFDGIFMHRYRDKEPMIRAECISALGVWVKNYPEHFLKSDYLRYLGWLLFDKESLVRNEAVKTISSLLDNETLLPGLREFIDRFKDRLIEMALKDTHLETKIESLELSVLLFNHGLLEEEYLPKLICSLFDSNKKLKTAVKPLWMSMWNDEWYPSFIDGLKANLDMAVVKLACFSKYMSPILFDYVPNLMDSAHSDPNIILFHGDNIERLLFNALDTLKEDLPLINGASVSLTLKMIREETELYHDERQKMIVLASISSGLSAEEMKSLDISNKQELFNALLSLLSFQFSDQTIYFVIRLLDRFVSTKILSSLDEAEAKLIDELLNKIKSGTSASISLSVELIQKMLISSPYTTKEILMSSLEPVKSFLIQQFTDILPVGRLDSLMETTMRFDKLHLLITGIDKNLLPNEMEILDQLLNMILETTSNTLSSSDSLLKMLEYCLKIRARHLLAVISNENPDTSLAKDVDNYFSLSEALIVNDSDVLNGMEFPSETRVKILIILSEFLIAAQSRPQLSTLLPHRRLSFDAQKSAADLIETSISLISSSDFSRLDSPIRLHDIFFCQRLIVHWTKMLALEIIDSEEISVLFRLLCKLTPELKEILGLESVLKIISDELLIKPWDRCSNPERQVQRLNIVFRSIQKCYEFILNKDAVQEAKSVADNVVDTLKGALSRANSNLTADEMKNIYLKTLRFVQESLQSFVDYLVHNQTAACDASHGWSLWNMTTRALCKPNQSYGLNTSEWWSNEIVPMIEEKLSKAHIQVTKGKDWNEYHSFIKLTSRKSNVKRQKEYSPEKQDVPVERRQSARLKPWKSTSTETFSDRESSPDVFVRKRVRL